MKSLVDDITHKAENRRYASNEKPTTHKSFYKVPQNIVLRETIVNRELLYLLYFIGKMPANRYRTPQMVALQPSKKKQRYKPQ